MSVVAPLNPVNPYTINEEDPAQIDALWLGHLVDTINSTFEVINARLVALGG